MAIDTVEFLRGKNILVIGATGFLGKVFMEKILRVQPEVGCIFALIRAKNIQSARTRLQNQVISSELFRLIRERCTEDGYEKLMAQKLVPVVGDIALDFLGIEESVRDELCPKIHIVVNSAATTSFYERYDIAMKVNALGCRNLINFCKSCCRLEALCHISTAYVNVESTGIITEEVLKMGEKLPYNSRAIEPSDIESECYLMRKSLKEFRIFSEEKWSEENETKHMKELGLKRAREFGWPNAYVLTKAMGEMMVDYLREDIPTIIIRPSIIESSITEPFAGWMEGNRMIDPLIVGYGKGRITSFLIDPLLILDVIPVDMVANSMIVSIARHGTEPGLFLYHATSSVANPLHYNVVVDATYNYFLKNPCTAKNGKVVRVKEPYFLQSMSSFTLYMTLCFKIPLQLLCILDKLLFGFLRPHCNHLLDKYRFGMSLAQIYEPFLFFKGKFDSSKTERLWEEMSGDDRKIFSLDVKSINWEDYFLNSHIPGLVKYIIRR
ncbi:hypothetical protein SUGI_0760110 [Cryptomeria japonica]|uniref:probable fatty acyl-CoA reductase 5 n=1 Tax=Cryptomeria japonica TaxID=3369 RepID=UPI002414BDB7|nr:probable fatty acyl-CoA reductase 5 [Cryptomeria japonica]GLJ37421.1 hypothetical protein SUGI_0760110 [Cryptomeria japonica]